MVIVVNEIYIVYKTYILYYKSCITQPLYLSSWPSDQPCSAGG